MGSSVQVSTQAASAIVARLRTAGCVFAEDEAALLVAAAADSAQLESMVERRMTGLPLEQVMGYAEFCGLRIVVEPGVFVPRHRTEFLVTQAIAVTSPGDTVLDMCCGVGAIGAALLASVEGITVHATDVEPAAVRCARRNLSGPMTHVYEGNLFDPLPPSLRGSVNVLVANAPYVPTDAIALLPAEARDHEPLVALDGGHDGLSVHRRIAAGAPQWLATGGCVLIETTEVQAVVMIEVFAGLGFTTEIIRSDDWGATVVVARLGRR